MPKQDLPSLSFHFREPGNRIVETLSYTVGESPDGLVLIASSPHGLCAVFLGDDADTLAWRLAQAFPGNPLRVDDAGLKTMLEQVVALSSHQPCSGGLTLDIAGTAFQQDVWKALALHR
ncbi:MAG: hypothetical protein WCY98_09300 [Castellaniella sp.]